MSKSIRQVTKRTPLTVGVFQDQSAEEINSIIVSTGIDLVQLHGHEPPEFIDLIHAPCIKVLHISSTAEEVAKDEDLSSIASLYSSRAVALLLDTKTKGSSGGTGVTFDWNVVERIDMPVLLAGGLHEGNILEALKVKGIVGVDASSGLEMNPKLSPGRKDIVKLRNYVRLIRKSPATLS